VTTYHLGRLLDHVHLRVTDLDVSKRFYVAVLATLGRDVGGEDQSYFFVDELFVSADGEPTRGIHLAFQAIDREAVERFHAAGLAAGGADNGGPGERRYHPGYYAAYLRDPDCNNVEAVYHGPAMRSAVSITVEPEHQA
jgi:catechol 2,3-dioxygenase-like lactoylglutathione lyase family enzyme